MAPRPSLTTPRQPQAQSPGQPQVATTAAAQEGLAAQGTRVAPGTDPSDRGDAAEPSKAPNLELQPGSQQPGGSVQRQMAVLRIESALHLSGSPAWYEYSHGEPRVRLFVRAKATVPGEQAWQCSTPPAIPVPSLEPGSFSADWHHQAYLSVSTDTTLCCEVSRLTVRLCLWSMLRMLLSSVWRCQKKNVDLERHSIPRDTSMKESGFQVGATAPAVQAGDPSSLEEEVLGKAVVDLGSLHRVGQVSGWYTVLSPG